MDFLTQGGAEVEMATFFDTFGVSPQDIPDVAGIWRSVAFRPMPRTRTFVRSLHP